MGRGDLSRALLLAAAVAAAAATTAAAATGLRFTVLETGTTTPSGTQRATGYIAVTRVQDRKFASRLDARGRTILRRLDFSSNAAVAVFLDGLPCSSDLTVNRVARVASTLTVTLHFTRPPIGFATCVRTSTPYVLLVVRRKAIPILAVPLRVKVVAVARS